jgi:hydrogenase maturation protease
VLAGYDAAVIVDAVVTGQRPVGEVFEIDPATLRPVASASPHFAGIPELLALADRLELQFPKRLRVVAVEVEDPYTVGGPMTPEVRAALPALCARVEQALEELERGA